MKENKPKSAARRHLVECDGCVWSLTDRNYRTFLILVINNKEFDLNLLAKEIGRVELAGWNWEKDIIKEKLNELEESIELSKAARSLMK